MRLAALSVVAYACLIATPLAAQNATAPAADDEIRDWSVSTTTTPGGIVKSVDAMASGTYGDGRDFDIIFIRMECEEGSVQLSMSRLTSDKSRIIEATFYKGYETADQQKLRTYWRSDDGQQDAVFDGSPDSLFSTVGDGPFDVLVGDQSGSSRLYSFDVQDTRLALARVKAECKIKR
jgi:hypothetical protein